MNFILWGAYTAFQKYLVFFFWTKDGEDSRGKLDLPCSLYLTRIKAKEKNICSEIYCQLQRTNRKPGPLSGENASYSLNLASGYWICNAYSYAEIFKWPDGPGSHSENHWESSKITITSTLDIYQTTNQTLPTWKVIKWRVTNTALIFH